MSLNNPPAEKAFKTLIKAAMAAAAPAVAAFVSLVSTSSVSLLTSVHLGEFGVAALGVLAAFLGYLLWKARWWAGLPALLVYAGGAVYFALKFLRPFSAYVEYNPIRDLGDLWGPLMMLSPSLVITLLCVGLGVLVVKGMILARRLQPLSVSPWAWGIILLWLVVLGGDALYQGVGWRYLKSPNDLVLRLCTPQKSEAREYLRQMGPEKIPALLEGMEVEDPDLDCLRAGSRELLLESMPEDRGQFIEAVRGGSWAALDVLGLSGDTRVVDPLLKLYRDREWKRTHEFNQALVKTIEKLDPTLHLEG